MATNNDRRSDTPFLTAMVQAESLRLNPNASRKELDARKKIIETWASLP